MKKRTVLTTAGCPRFRSRNMCLATTGASGRPAQSFPCALRPLLERAPLTAQFAGSQKHGGCPTLDLEGWVLGLILNSLDPQEGNKRQARHFLVSHRSDRHSHYFYPIRTASHSNYPVGRFPFPFEQISTAHSNNPIDKY